MRINGSRKTLDEFASGSRDVGKLEIGPDVLERLKKAYAHVETLAAGEEPIYGLNTGLGSNLGYRINPEDISDFQMQIISGRAVSCGDLLHEHVGRGILLSRIISAAKGLSGISPELFSYLCKAYETGISPAVPEYGSIGDSDLVQNAHFALGVLGNGEAWIKGKIVDGDNAIQRLELSPPLLKPKEGLALISHSGLTITLASDALIEAKLAIEMAKAAIILSYEGYGANRKILLDDLNNLRKAPGQAEAARWFKKALEGSEDCPRRIQEALSFRTVASVIGAAEHAIGHALSVWEDELNGVSDSPVILENGKMLSTINFNTTALSLAIEGISLALASVANGCVQRMQRMTNAELSGLSKNLSPVGGSSAGFIPSQKTASALLTEIRHAAIPIMFDPAPISVGVEDMAPNTPAAIQKLLRQLHPFKHLTGLEALIACQAIDLRNPASKSKLTSRLHSAVRKEIAPLNEDRAFGPEINLAASILESEVNSQL